MKRSNRSWERLTWLFPIMVMIGLGLAIRIAVAPPDNLVSVVLGTLLVLTLAWIFVSVLWPARADRTCPECGAKAVERLDEDASHGIICRACDWRDEASSAWLLAEDDGVPLEGIVLEQRRERAREARSRRAPSTTTSSVDTSARGH